MYEAPAPLFEVHRWVLPATTCDYPILAVAQDGSVLLALGGHSLTNPCLPDIAWRDAGGRTWATDRLAL